MLTPMRLPKAEQGLRELCEWLKDKCPMRSIVEIGSYAGESATIFADYFDIVHCVDPWGCECAEAYPAFLARTEGNKKIRHYRMTSATATRLFQDKSLDVVYIDGRHHYDSVRQDIAMWTPKAKIVCGHDYVLPRQAEVVKGVDSVYGKPMQTWRDHSWVGELTDTNAPVCKRVLYDHVPRCGGTTVGNWLTGLYPLGSRYLIPAQNPERSTLGALWFLRQPEQARHAYRYIWGHGAMSLMGAVHPDTVTATCLRHPVQRIISHYWYARSRAAEGRRPAHYLHDKAMDMSLLEYATSGLSPELSNDMTRRFSDCGNPDKSAVDKALVNLSKYDIVGVTENMPDFMARLAKVVGVVAPVATPADNKALRGMAATQSDMDAIAEHNSLDMQLYNEVCERVKNGPI